MRITNKMSISSVLQNIQTNLTKMDKSNNMLSSGRKINMPQDDPAGAIKAMGYRGNIQEIQQYSNNAAMAKNIVNATDSALSETSNILQRARELAVKGANGAFEQGSLDSIGDEISQMIDQMLEAGNSKVGQRYIFGGFKTTEPPFKSYTGSNDAAAVPPGPGANLTDINGTLRSGINSKNITVVSYQGDNGRMKTEIAENVSTEVNISGQEIFVNPDGENIFNTLINLRDSLFKGDTDGIENAIENIDKSSDQLLRYRAEVGAKMNRLESTEAKLKDLNISITELLSKTEDTDVVKTIMELKVQESVQRMSLSVGAKVIQPTLVDFLK